MEQLARMEVIFDDLHENPSCPHGILSDPLILSITFHSMP